MSNFIPIHVIALGLTVIACGAPDDAGRSANPGAETAAAIAPDTAARMPVVQPVPDTPAPSQTPPASTVPAAQSDRRAVADTTASEQPTVASKPEEGGAVDQAQDPAAMLSKTAGVYEGIRSMQAEFSMVTTNPLLHSTARSRGTLYQRRPDRILLRFTEPKGDIILGDGRYFWIYYPSVDAQQVTRTSAMNASGVVDLQAQFVGNPLERFAYTYGGHESVEGRDAAVFTLVPHEDPGYRVLKVWIDTKDYLVRRFEVTDNAGIVRRLELTDLQTNPAMPDDLFRFTPPPGAKIVERG